jgi:hypothetical protein
MPGHPLDPGLSCNAEVNVLQHLKVPARGGRGHLDLHVASFTVESLEDLDIGSDQESSWIGTGAVARGDSTGRLNLGKK